jgi:hypothetical protein
MLPKIPVNLAGFGEKLLRPFGAGIPYQQSSALLTTCLALLGAETPDVRAGSDRRPQRNPCSGEHGGRALCSREPVQD